MPDHRGFTMCWILFKRKDTCSKDFGRCFCSSSSSFAHAKVEIGALQTPSCSCADSAVRLMPLSAVPKQSPSSASKRWTAPGRPWIDGSIVLWTRPFSDNFFQAGAIIGRRPFATGSTAEPARKPWRGCAGSEGPVGPHHGEPVVWFACLHVVGITGHSSRQISSALVCT